MNYELIGQFQSWSRIAGTVVIAVGTVVLIGWGLDIPVLKSLHPSLVSMKANTAFSFVLIGMALRLSQQDQSSPHKLRIARWSATAVALIGLLSLGEYLLGTDFGIDQMLFTETQGAVATSMPGRMAPNTAFNFLLAGLALRFLDSELGGRHRPAQYLALVILVVALLAVLGYAYDIQSLYGFAAYTKMALHTTVAFVVLSLGILAARAGNGMMATVTGIGAGGQLARQLLPAAIALPILIGWLCSAGTRDGLYDTEFRLSLVVMLNILVFVSLIWRYCRSLEETDIGRMHAETSLRAARDDLENRVQERTAELLKSNAAARQEIVERARAETRLHQLMQEMRETVHVLNTSATEILEAAMRLGSSSAETAAAVIQATSTVEEVKQTARLATEKAQFVAETAQNTAQVSQRGRKSVQESADAMQHIQQQMESSAESIALLSEQSQAIGEIMASVTDLAEQSKLLAVNAAIEAAKAGDQGKGFAVVAQEIKRLAEQSKQASTQVRTILNDIRKATGTAVFTAEQGNKAVASGMERSAQADEAIRMLADSIDGAAQAATQIAVSAQQQWAGMDQVALAMHNIGQASTQNVISTRQTEETARKLHELGLKLKQLAAAYQPEMAESQESEIIC
ncbi:MAG: methyl-accepting chemotaxis protein [Methylophilaceae bacterium]|jgi:methyl-accepting chemotaxis protein|nr:methyl-accepting chemotaxis protein [Methylophilaceae bacterium]